MPDGYVRLNMYERGKDEWRIPAEFPDKLARVIWSARMGWPLDIDEESFAEKLSETREDGLIKLDKLLKRDDLAAKLIDASWEGYIKNEEAKWRRGDGRK